MIVADNGGGATDIPEMTDARRVAIDLLREAGDEQGARLLEFAANICHFICAHWMPGVEGYALSTGYVEPIRPESRQRHFDLYACLMPTRASWMVELEHNEALHTDALREDAVRDQTLRRRANRRKRKS